MPTSVTMPALGESVTEGTVTRWLKQEGEQVEVDEPLLEVSTDKVDTEIPSPAAGVLTKILVAEDETVEVGAELAVIGGGRRRRRAGEAAAGQEPRRTRRAGRSRPEQESRRPPRTGGRPEPAAGAGRSSGGAAAAAVAAARERRSPCRRWARASPRAPSPGG